MLSQVHRRHPAFNTTYENTQQKLVVRLSTCFFLIHQEALLDVIHVVAALLKDTGLLNAEPATSRPQRARPTRDRKPLRGKRVSHFYRAMHFSAKRGIAIACRLSVRLSVCPSVRL